jgi:hypothetical protein
MPFLRLGYKIRLRQMCSMQFGQFQRLHNDDSREKPRSEALAIHLGSECGSDQPSQKYEGSTHELMGKDVPSLLSVKLIYHSCSRLRAAWTLT